MSEVPDLRLRIAGVSAAVTVRVFLVWVVHLGAVVLPVEDPIAVIVPALVAVFVAGITDAVVVLVSLLFIGDQRAVILVIVHTVAIVVFVTDVALTVAVGVCLIAVGVEGAVVAFIYQRVAVIVGVTDIALAVAVGVGLLVVEFVGAVVDAIRHAVAVLIRLARAAGQLTGAAESFFQAAPLAAQEALFTLILGLTWWRVGDRRAATHAPITDKGRRAVAVQLTEDQEALTLGAHIVAFTVGLRAAWLVAVGARAKPAAEHAQRPQP